MTTTQHGTFMIERSYGASPRRVFAAWSNADSKRAWFVEGKGFSIAKYELDSREGGGERSSFKSDAMPGVFGNETTFDDIVENERIVFTYAMSRDGVRFSISLATVEFKPEGPGTRLVFTEHAAFFDGADGIDMRRAGWSGLLDRLGKFLDD